MENGRGNQKLSPETQATQKTKKMSNMDTNKNISLKNSLYR